MKLLRPSDYQKMPWKNGGGVTEEIAREPADGDYLWRMSRARIQQEGPFSVFPGYDRLLVIVEGGGIKLNGRLLPTFEILRFAGEDANHCTLPEGFVVDLGLIYRRGLIQAEMKVIPGGAVPTQVGEGLHFLYCAKGSFELNQMRISEGETLRIQGSTEFSSSLLAGVAVLISVRADKGTSNRHLL